MNPTTVHYKVVLLDESCYYTEPYLAKLGGKVMRAFLFDANKAVNCCELTPSYELIPLYSTCAGDISDDLFDDLRQIDSDDNDITYHHCSYIDKLPASRFHVYEPYTLGEDETYEEVEEKYEENANCNPPIECGYGELNG